MIFKFGSGWPQGLLNRTICLQIDQLGTEQDRERHWSNVGYRPDTISNSRFRGCLMMNSSSLCFGYHQRHRVLQGFQHQINTRNEWNFNFSSYQIYR